MPEASIMVAPSHGPGPATRRGPPAHRSVGRLGWYVCCVLSSSATRRPIQGRRQNGQTDVVKSVKPAALLESAQSRLTRRSNHASDGHRVDAMQAGYSFASWPATETASGARFNLAGNLNTPPSPTLPRPGGSDHHDSARGPRETVTWGKGGWVGG